MLLAVAQPAFAQLLDGGVVAQGAEYIVQRFAVGAVHLHIAAGDHGQLAGGGKAMQAAVTREFVVAEELTGAQPYPVAAQSRQLQSVGAGIIAVV